MTYTYVCLSCEHDFERNVPISDRDKPVSESCPSCGKIGHVNRSFDRAPGISYEGVVTPIRRAGSGWNDVLKKISKYAGRRSQVDHY